LFVLGHLGLGPRLLGPLRRRLPVRWLLFGCLLPDLLDKPLFYALLWAKGDVVPPVLGSRSFGHTFLFLLLLAAFALLRRTPAAWAVAAGVSTHFALDLVGELFASGDPASSIWLALLWPFLGWNFPLAHFHTPREHLEVALESWYVIAGEIAGLAVLLDDWRRRR
jgi:hypothetical protein